MTAGMLFGSQCPVCEVERQEPSDGVCEACGRALSKGAEARCPRCAARLGPHVLVDKRCTVCRTQAFDFRSVRAAFSYEGAVRRQVHAAKFARQFVAGRRLAAAFARGIDREMLPDDVGLIVPVPAFWWDRRMRGVSLAEELSTALAAKLKIEHGPGVLRQTRPSAPQFTLSPAERARNVEGLFKARNGTDLARRVVLLVDDILTTGATAGECTRALEKAGAKAVHVAVLARTEPPS